MARTQLDDDRRALHERMERSARWLRRRSTYAGSMQTVDLVGEGWVRLYASDHYRRRAEEQPRALWGLVNRLMRNVLVDSLRRRTAQRRSGHRVSLHDVPVSDHLDQALVEHERRVLVDRELDRLRADTHRFRDPGAMVRAFELARDGLSHADIAGELGVGRSTVTGWVDLVTAYLTRRLAGEESP